MKKNLVPYLFRWMVFGVIAGYFAPVISANLGRTMQDGYFWGMKLHHMMAGLLVGAACGIAFTLFQNKYNSSRKKNVTWGIVLAVWIGFNLVFAGISLSFR